ncbi:MAG: head-tail connector protein [Rhizobiaceae bacterium]|nr:head-tail connector protein [Rhizobiaceae bacterium]
MTLIRMTGPEVEPVTLAELKQYLRLSHSSEDELLAGLLRAAREDVERVTGLALIEQGWRLVMDRPMTGGMILLPRHPVREVVSVTLYAQDGTPQILDAGAYQTDTLSRPARILLAEQAGGLRAMNGVEVEFTCGFGEAGPDVPDLLRRAITHLAAHWYEFRTSFGPSDQPVSYPAGYERMISGYIERRL